MRFIQSTIISLLIGLATCAEWVEGEALVQLRAESVGMPLGCVLVREYPEISRLCGRRCLALRSEGTTEALLARLQADPTVLASAPNHLRSLFDLVVPQDPNAAEQYGLDNRGIVVNGLQGIAGADIGFSAARRLSRDVPPEVIIAVFDTGVDYRHPDLAANIWVNPLEIPGNGRDDDGNGVVDDIHGFDAAGDLGAASDGDPMDAGLAVPHGTHVSGIAAAVNGNGIGGSGANPTARIMAIKVSPNGVAISSDALIAGCDYVLTMRRRAFPIAVINVSLGGRNFNFLEFEAFRRVAEDGVMIAAAAGNSASNNDGAPLYPANYNLDEVISVAATDARDRLADFSNFGSQTVDIAAPGDRVLSSLPTHLGTLAEVSDGDGVQVTGRGMIYSGLTSDAGITNELVYAGIGRPNEFPANTAGRIALVDRGTLFFSEKVNNATAAGALGIIIANNEPGLFDGSLQFPSGENIPGLAVSQADGLILRNLVGQRVTLRNAFNEAQGYEYFDGTSMSAPMVAGALAMLAQHYPEENTLQWRNRLLAAADSLSTLDGAVSGSRRLNMRAILDVDSDGLPDWWEQEQVGNLTALDGAGDADGDGFTNEQEYMAASDPIDPVSGLALQRMRLGPARGELTMVWDSLPRRQYRILGQGFDGGSPTSLIEGITSTPPVNTLSLPADPAVQMFRLEIE